MRTGRAPRSRRHRHFRLGGAVAALAVVLAVLLAGLGVPGLVNPELPAAADSSSPPYYLAIGASESVGVQPTTTDPRDGAPTNQGYAGDLTAIEQARWPGLHLAAIGCPGETALQAVRGTGPCHYVGGSQLATAVAFLHAHAPSTVLATVDLGFNDLRSCLAGHAIDNACVAQALSEVGQSLSQLLAQLKAAGGPGLHIVGLEHNNPYLGFYTSERPGARAFAEASETVFSQFNAVLADTYRAAGVPVAGVPAAYDGANEKPTVLAPYGTVPTDVARVCTLTWACADSQFPHNVHPNSQGYRVIAAAIASALGGP